MNKIVKPMPAPEDHAPLSVLNPHSEGIRTMTVCSCEWMPKTPPMRGSTKANAHMAHRRSLGLPRANYAREVFGQGPWMGLTWDEWYAHHGGQNIDPFTGQRDR
jgi:hypothetical protein